MAKIENPQCVLSLENVFKSFAGSRALSDISFDLRAGEVHALVGENGAGKSTLTKIITGAIAPDSGAIKVFGERVADNSPTVSRDLRIAAIYQQPLLFPDLTVAENIALARDGGYGIRRVDWKARFVQARTLLGRLGSALDPRRLARTLSMSEQQIVEIAKAIGADARILLMDEPTAVLTEPDVAKLLSLVDTLRSDGVAIIYVSHRLEEILSIADRITVLRDGERVACRAAAEVDRTELIRLMVGRPIASLFPKRTVPKGTSLLKFTDCEIQLWGIHSISFNVRRAGRYLGSPGWSVPAEPNWPGRCSA